MTKSKILILANTFYPVLGGVETHLTALIKEISKNKNIEAHLIAYTYFREKNNPYIGLYSNVKVNLLKLAPKPGNAIYWLECNLWTFYFFYAIFPLFIFTLFYCLKNKSFNVVHANSHTTGIVAIWICRIFKIRKKYISMHGVMFSRLKNFQRYMMYRNLIKRRLGKFDKIFCIGKRSFEEIRHLLGTDDKLELFRYWVDDNIFTPKLSTERTKHIGFGRKGFIFYAGRLVETKGILLLLKIAAQLTEYNFAIAGDGDLKNLVEEESRKHSNIKYLGKLNSDQLPIYYQTAKISILLTLTDGEGIPNTLVESIACGTPVLATRRGGTSELVDLGVGLAVKNNQKDVKAKINLIVGNEKLYQEKRRACKIIARKYFSSQNAQIFIKNYLN